MIRSLFVFIILFSLSSPALAFESVRFTSKELDAAFVLMRPELNSVEIHGRTGVFTPSPSLKFLKVQRTEFKIDMSGIANIVDIEFNHLKAKAPKVKFESNEFILELPIFDQDYALQSRVGSISTRGVSLFAHFGFKKYQNGTQELVLNSTGISGTLYGSGVLRSGFILGRVRNLFLNILAEQLENLLAKPELQDAIQTGLLSWSKFYTGAETRAVIPGSIQFFKDAAAGGISYQVE